MAVATGFVGLGVMGTPMAHNLVDAGYPLVVWNRTRIRTEPFAEQGATVVNRPRDVGPLAEVVVTMVSDDAALEEVLFGPEGVVQGMPSGGVVVDMSTTSPQAMTSTGERLSERGIGFVDAPVFGSARLAETRDLVAVVGADPKDLERVRAHLEVLCGAVCHLGPVGAGSLMKICGNIVADGMLSLLAEGLTLGRRGGLDQARMLDVLRKVEFASPMIDAKGAQVVAGDYTQCFPLRHALKDGRLALGVAAGMDLDLCAVRGVVDDYTRAAQAGFADEDVIAVIKGVDRPA